jgi:hypothetical protein
LIINYAVYKVNKYTKQDNQKMASFLQTLNTARNVVSTVSRTAGQLRTGNLSGALDSVTGGLASSISRSLNLPIGGETGTGAAATAAQFKGAEGDWRVRLSIPPAYPSSNLLAPLRDTKGFMFPYTPQIQISHSANYQNLAPVHNNYPFLSYENSRVDAITITGDFYCETSVDANYWVAAVHYLRSVTKMSYGKTANEGSPPPVVKLNGYGDFVFKNVPVVVSKFSVELPKDVDYISCGIGGSSSALSTAGGLTQRLGTGAAVSQVSNFLNNAAGVGAAGVGWAPVRSTITVTVQPLYSREAVRKFSLDSFVKGEYVSKGSGYL